jgi:hypothetical protein
VSPAKKLIALAGLCVAFVVPASAQADFGLVPGSTTATALSRNGTIDEQAGSHPGAFRVHFELKTDSSGGPEGGQLRDSLVDPPPGLIGNPGAVPACSRQQFEGFSPNCPADTQVGVLGATVPGFGHIVAPLYNVVPPPGVPTQFAFSVNGNNVFQYASVQTETGYDLRVSSIDVPIEVTDVTETIWGVPADPANDAERFCRPAGGGALESGCKSTAPLKPFLTMPANCDAPLKTTVQVDSKLDPGNYLSETVQSLDAGVNPAPLAGCDAVPFNPEIASQSTSKQASSPSGLDFTLKLPDQGLESPGATAETEPKKVVVTLPEGMTVNPSLAEGIGTCSQAQYGVEKLESKAGAGCPEASKLGSVIVHTPLLQEPVEGSLYLATPYENPFGTLSALYLVARAPERGIFVKQTGRIDLNESTGQITTTFENLPPIPFSTFELHFREGARAPLATPQACGDYQTVAKLTPFSASSDAEAIERTASFQIEHGAEGGACPGGGLPPFKPGLIAGSINNAAGRFSPFNVRLFRTDNEQEFTRFSIKLPPGILAKLAGIPFCPEADIAAAIARKGPHGGEEEINSPSCPQASEVGHSLVGAGVGQVLAYAPGKLYLGGPYHGSAISLVAITAAKVGPFDLGNVVLRYAFRIDPETGEVFIDATGSDPIPHIVKGVPVHAKDIRAYTDRPNFVLNPTNCSRTSTASTLLGSGLDFSSEADDRPVTVSTPYQAADCAALPFKPRLSLKLKGGTKRGSYPALKANLNMNGIGEAGIKRAEVVLPSSEFIANAHFNTICTRVQFKQGAHPGEMCPPGSIYGHAKAVTPLLSEPLEGPVYLRSSEHQLPDVVVALHNGEIDITLDGKVDSVKGRLRSTFESTPDAPVSSVVISLLGGKKGLFENSTNLCKGTHKAEANFTGQNGKEWDKRPELVAQGCKGSARKGKKNKRKA